jgi:NAD(P)-dependent dehydrogenase (short-subunit alcohol dehydrogenase family)
MDLSTKAYVVTGATSGIGFSTAEALARAGALVIGVGRSPERCARTEKSLRNLSGNTQVHYLVANLSLQSEIKQLAGQVADLLATHARGALDGLVNNAGTFTYWLTLTPEGMEMQWAVNHLAPFLLTNQLLPLLKAAPFARVVTVSSDSHASGHIHWADPQLIRRYNGLKAYGNTKLANVLFTLSLNRQLESAPHVRAFAADPGLVKTDIGMKGTPSLAQWIWKIRRSGGTGPEVPARGILYLLTEPSIQDSPEVYWKDGRPRRASRAALDDYAASRLWVLSAKMCGMQREAQHENG